MRNGCRIFSITGKVSRASDDQSRPFSCENILFSFVNMHGIFLKPDKISTKKIGIFLTNGDFIAFHWLFLMDFFDTGLTIRGYGGF